MGDGSRIKRVVSAVIAIVCLGVDLIYPIRSYADLQLPAMVIPLMTDRTPSLASPQPAASTGSISGGTSLYLDGNSYVAVPHGNVPVLGNGDFTLEAWVWPTSLTNCKAILGKSYADGLYFGICQSNLVLRRGASTFVRHALTIPLNQWSHVAVSSIYDPWLLKYATSFYINGETDGVYFATGDGTVGGTRDLHIGHDDATDFFVGDITEARIWNVERNAVQLRSTMHTAIDDAHLGLLAVWHLAGDFKAAIGNADATAVGSPQFFGAVSPAAPLVTPVDEFFNVITQPLYGAATAYIPRLNHGLLIGGYRSGIASANITSVDVATGASMEFATALPIAMGLSGAAYAESNDTVYVFGGSPDLAGGTVNTIYAIRPETGAVRTVEATLPLGLYNLAGAVYHPHLNKILIFGGYRLPEKTQNAIYVFDVATEAITQASFALPQPIYAGASVYSSADNYIYLFGGTDGATTYNTVIQIALADNGIDGATTAMPVTLPEADARMVAFEDPITRLLYVAGGSKTTRVLAFDPITGQLWRTPIELPKEAVNNAGPVYPAPASKIKPYASAFYSQANRHALIIGGDASGGVGTTAVWRILLGDGPLVQLGRWEYNDMGALINSMDGEGAHLILGTSNGAIQYDDGKSGANPLNQIIYSGGNTPVVRWSSGLGKPFLAQTAGVRLGWPDGSTTLIYNTGPVMSMANAPNRLPIIGINGSSFTPPGAASGYVPVGSSNSYSYQGVFPNCTNPLDIGLASRTLDSGSTYKYWGLVVDTSCGALRNLPQAATPDQPNAPQLYMSVQLRQLSYDFLGNWSQRNLGQVCDRNLIQPNTFSMGSNGDLWIGGFGGICRYPAAHLPDSPSPLPSFRALDYATNAFKSGIDRDGRIWFSTDGGLTVYEMRKDNATNLTTMRSADYNWRNAPIGGYNNSSALGPLAAVDEKVWASRGASLFSVAQRWQQVEQAEVRRLWTARGRLFASTADGLRVLQPDGLTWEIAPTPVNALQVDGIGHVWLGTDAGASWWSPNANWQAIPDLNLNEPVYALAEDVTGRMWLGLQDGLGMYDRNRLVTRVALPTGAISVTSLLADLNGGVWAGTSVGVARFDPSAATWTLFNTANQGISSLYPLANQIRDIELRHDGRIYLSTADPVGGVYVYDDGATKFRRIANTPAMQPLAADELGRIWAGNSIELQEDRWQTYYWTNSGIRTSRVNDVATDKADRVWFAHPNGGISVRGAFLPPLVDEQIDISSISPNSGSYSDTLTIIGSGFGTDASAIEVTIGGAHPIVRSVSAGAIVVQLTRYNLTGTVAVRRGKKAISVGSDRQPAFCAVPKIDSLSNTGGNAGVRINIRGGNIDPSATVKIGNGPARVILNARPGSLGKIGSYTLIDPQDTSGNLVVTNRCVGKTAFVPDIHKINIYIDKLALNQGYEGMGLRAYRPTLVSAWLTQDQPKRDTDVIQLSALQATVNRKSDNKEIHSRSSPVSLNKPIPIGFTPELSDTRIANAQNIPSLYLGVGEMAVHVQLLNGSAVVAERTRDVTAQQNWDYAVLLVPMLPKNLSPATRENTLQAMHEKVRRNLNATGVRMMPLGGIDYGWSNDVMEIDPVDVGTDNPFTGLRAYGVNLMRIAVRHNSGNGRRYDAVMGVIAPGLNTGNIPASSFRPSSAAAANLWLSVPDSFCDLENFVIHTYSFGLLGSSDGCHLTVPGNVSWVDSATADDSLGKSMIHELGHTLDLVDESAANYDPGNDGHSYADEAIPEIGIDNCGARVDEAYTFIQANRIQGMIVNPITMEQFDQTDLSNRNSKKRPAAIMAYACGRYNNNSFFESPDLTYVDRYVYTGISLGVLHPALQTAQGQATAQPSTLRVTNAMPGNIPGMRLVVNGILTRTAAGDTAEIVQVETRDEATPLSVPLVSGYWLVQRDETGAELTRWPVSVALDQSQRRDTATPSMSYLKHNAIIPISGLFGASMPLTIGVRSIALLKDQDVLATFASGVTPPVVTLGSPVGGEDFGNGSINVTWTATDPSSDLLEVSLEYSSDDGISWEPVHAAHGSGTSSIPISLLSSTNGPTGRMRIVASNGFTRAIALSAGFTVLPQRPLAYIDNPRSGKIVLEGDTILLSGRGEDNHDSAITATQSLTWHSNRDGFLGHGPLLDVILSVGTHTITLDTRNTAGLTDTAQITLVVAANYAEDGIPDHQKQVLGLNLLSSREAFSDADSDGLTLRTELEFGTNPLVADSDADGRTDAQEVSTGTAPIVADAAFAPDSLRVSPAAISVTIDLSTQALVYQTQLQVRSDQPVSWTMNALANWVLPGQVSGDTPAPLTLVIDPSALTEGVHTTTLRFSSSQLSNTVAVPVMVNLVNKANYCDVTLDGSTNAADVIMVQSHVGMVQSQAGYRYAYDANRDGRIDVQDVALVQSCVMMYGDVPAKQVFFPIVNR